MLTVRVGNVSESGIVQNRSRCVCQELILRYILACRHAQVITARYGPRVGAITSRVH